MKIFSRIEAISILGDVEGKILMKTIQTNNALDVEKVKQVLVPFKHWRTGTESTSYQHVNCYDVDKCISLYKIKLEKSAKNKKAIRVVLDRLLKLKGGL